MSGESGLGGLPLTPTRFLLGVIIPGIVAAAPWLMLVAEIWPDARGFYEKYPILGNGLLFAIVTIVGTVIEGLGSYRESAWDDKLEAEFAVVKNWFAYLAQDSSPEPVGHRYISRLATSLYFELGMMISTPILLVGIAVLGATTAFPMSPIVGLGFVIVAIIVFCFFRKAARDSHRALCRARKELVARRAAKPQTGTQDA
jgi:hypothetical protein